MSLPVSSASIEFETLLSRDYQPSRISRLRVQPLPSSIYEKHVVNTTQESERDEEQKQMKQSLGQLPASQRALLNKVTSQTPAFLQHLSEDERQRVLQERSQLLGDNGGFSTNNKSNSKVKVPPQFSALEMTNWTADIDWGDEEDEENDTTNQKTKESNSSSSISKVSKRRADIIMLEGSSVITNKSLLKKLSPMALEALQQQRNPALENLNLDSLDMDVDAEELEVQADSAQIRLELGVAGQSVARQKYQSMVATAQHPTPAILQWAYQARVEREWAGAGGKGGVENDPDISEILGDISTANINDVRKLTKRQYDALIEARSKKREQMAKDKTNRVTAAMGTLAMGAGKGRAITSSLMGPGGTERTGRPSRHMNAAGTLEHEYIEQNELVSSHAFARDLSKILLREYHRPKIPLSVVRPDLSWQFQIRYSHKKDVSATGEKSASFHRTGAMMRAAGQAQTPTIRDYTDLSPTFGKLVLVEYSEERPPIQMNRGMCSKIINYFRGDKTKCPVSKGGGDKPARRKRNDNDASDKSGLDGPNSGDSNGKKKQQNDRLPRLKNSKESNNILDWIGPLPKKSKDLSKMSGDKEDQSIDVLPEGVTEILHPTVHGPFLGEVPEGQTLTGLVSNLFVAPMFRHEAESTDFLMILTPPKGATKAGQRESNGVVLRDFPESVFTVGQTEPRTRVHAPGTPGEKAFVGPFVSFMIARAITKSENAEGHGLRLDELQTKVLPSLELPGNAFRQRLKQVAVYDKNISIWDSKKIGFEGYPGVEALGRAISPEAVAAFETTCAASRRLADLGIHQLFSGNNTALSVGVCCVYLAGQLNAARELSRKMKRLVEISRSKKDISSIQAVFHEKASADIEALYKVLRHKHEVAQFIHEELQLAPWHLTGEFIDVHKKAEGTGMMKLTGLGDPSGMGEGFSFLREVDSKPSKSVGNAALSAQVKKITGTEDDLRKLTMQQMASLLRSYGMAQKQIDTLKRWDRVHCIRDLSTKAASDGTGDGLERFARGEKLKLSEQKQMYRERIQEIWRRQITALSQGDTSDKGSGEIGDNASIEGAGSAPAAAGAQAKKDMSSDSDSEMDGLDDLADELEQDMMNQSEANQLLTAHAGTTGGKGAIRGAADQDNELNKDARDFSAFRRELEEEKAAQEGMQASNVGDVERHVAAMANRKVIRKKITKTYPDGRQTTTFKFILHPEEVGKIEARLSQSKDDERPRQREWNYESAPDEKPPGHSMFEDEDDFEYSSRGRMHGKRRGGGRKRGDGRITPRGRGALQFGKLKTKTSKEERMRKRKREEEELEVYNAQAKRKSTNNRRERGSIRDRRPHVIFAEKLEAIRAAIESRPYAAPFLKPVNRKLIPRYYEVISNPIDLQTIRNKIAAYEYRKADALLEDFELMKSNAIKFNGQGNHIAQEGVHIYDFVKDQIQASRSELNKLEQAVEDQMNTKPKGKRKGKGAGSKKKGGTTADVAGVTINLGDVQAFEDDSDSGEDDETFLDSLGM